MERKYPGNPYTNQQRLLVSEAYGQQVGKLNIFINPILVDEIKRALGDASEMKKKEKTIELTS